MPLQISRERKPPGEITKPTHAVTREDKRDDTGEPSSEAKKAQLNTASRFYNKRVKNKKYGEGNVTFVSSEEPNNKLSILFDGEKEPRKFYDLPDVRDPLKIIGPIPKVETAPARPKTKKGKTVELAAAAAAGAAAALAPA